MFAQPMVVDGYLVPADYAIVYMTGAAHRDPAVFDKPSSFVIGR
jgi:cytochrome P450